MARKIGEITITVEVFEDGAIQWDTPRSDTMYIDGVEIVSHNIHAGDLANFRADIGSGADIDRFRQVAVVFGTITDDNYVDKENIR